jgi:FkbM family methyltransferase
MTRHGWRQAAVRVGMPCAVVMLRWWFRHGRPTSANKFIWERFCRPYLNWRRCELKARTKFGDIFDLVLSEAVQQQIAYFGVWEPNLTHFLESRLANDGIFVDIGANVGYFSLLASHVSRRVIAFEASPDIFDKLAKNILINKRNNITIYNLAVSGTESKVYISPGPPGNLGATSIVTAYDDESMGALTVVRAAPLCETLGDEILREVRFIKIDVEGSEYPILCDLLRFNQKLRSDVEIVAEVDPASVQAYGSTLSTLLEEYRRAGFSIYEMANDYSAVPYLRRSDPIPPRPLNSVPTVRTDLLLTRQLDGS